MLKAMTCTCKCDFEIIVNSLCYMNCPLRMYHYNQIAQCAYQKNDIATSYYSNRCFMRRQKNPVDYLRNAFIRQKERKIKEELEINDLGCKTCNHCKNYFELSCRSNTFKNKFIGQRVKEQDPFRKFLEGEE